MEANLKHPKSIRKRVGIDMDGTLALFHDTFLAEYNAIHKTHYTLADFSSWNKWKIPIRFPAFMKMYNEIWTKRWAEIKPSITEPTLRRLAEGYDIDILTHRSKGHEPYLRGWLNLHFPELQHRIGIRITESSEAKTLHDHDILFDDAPPLAKELIKLDMARPHLFLVEQPWNAGESYQGHGRIITRVKSLEAGIDLLMRKGPETSPQTNK